MEEIGVKPDLTVLSDKIAFRVNEVLNKTRELSSVGFMFDGKQFPATKTANFNYQVIKTNKSTFTFPKNIGQLNGVTYQLLEVDVDSFWLAAKNFIEPILDRNRDLINDIVTSTTIAELDLIIDNR
jgi:hypothetical protein